MKSKQQLPTSTLEQRIAAAEMARRIAENIGGVFTSRLAGSGRPAMAGKRPRSGTDCGVME
jgi:hypothetical protein